MLHYLYDSQGSKKEGDIMTDSQKLDLLLSKLGTMETDIQTIKTDIQSAKMELYDEIIRAETAIDKNDETLKTLNTKYDTLLLKADNTDLLLRLINRQATEMDELKNRLEILEKKIS